MGLLVCGGLIAASTSIAQEPGAPPAQPVLRAPDDAVNTLLSKLSLDEKLGQLTLQWGGPAEDNNNPETRKKSEAELLDAIRSGRCGALIGVHGAAFGNRLQRIAIEESPHRIPLLFGNDVIHGYHTIFPIPLAESCSWNLPLLEQSAHIAAVEARAAGTHWTFAPMVDITHDPRWGRIAEGAGEDPLIGSMAGAARVRGFQGKNLSASDSVLACAKHFAAYGAAEGGRDYNIADISEPTLHDIFLPPFRATVQAGVGTLMSAFNEINGVPASANETTLVAILRRNWGFRGFVVSDWNSVTEMVHHGFVSDDAEAAAKSITAGVDMDMSSSSYRTHLAQAVRSGAVSESAVNEAVRNVLRMKFALGLFDHPFADPEREKKLLLCDEHRRIARDAARQSIVLLRNEAKTLPLSPEVRSIAVLGPLADNQREPLGTWAVTGKFAEVIPVLEKNVVTTLSGVKERVSPNTKVQFARGCEIDGKDQSGFQEAVRLAKESDAVVMIVGESRDMSGEAASRTSLDLPGVQQQLIEAVHATGKPMVVVVLSGRPLALSWIAENVSAVIQAWHLGTESGHAIADVLFGDFNPCGRLTVTVPRNVGQIPIYYNHKNTGRPPSADNKFTSKYLDVPWTPLYPFGFGLTYAKFDYANLRLAKARLSKEDRLEVQVDLKNIGSRSGTEVVQLYVRDPVASLTRPVRELKAFERVTLEPGVTRTVTLHVPVATLGFHNRQLRYVVEPGKFRVWVGPNAAEGLEAEFEVASDR